MTVENSVSKTPKLVMGAKTYDFNFDVLLEDPTTEDAKRAIKCAISDGTTETELIYGTDYTVTLNSDKKGGVVTVTDTKNSDWHIVIYRQYNMTQGVDLNDYNEFPAETIERAFDKQTMLIQELKEIAERSVKVTPANNQTPEELLDEVYSKLDSATEVATNAIAAATLATTAAESATKAVEDAEQQVQEVTQYIDDKKVEIDGIVVDAQNSVDGAIQQAVEDVKQAAVNEAESVIQDAGATATNIAVDYVNTTVKPELQGISDNAQQYATNAKASQEAAKVSETNAKASETASKQSETNAKVSETNAKNYANSVNPENLLNTKMITNCLTHIPQDIKLELVDGTLTLKAGSKVYVPNGFEADGTTPKFDEVVVESDKTYTTSTSTEKVVMFISYNFTTGSIMSNWVSQCSSGSTVPSSFQYGFFYNTTDNTIFDYRDVKSDNQVSLPLAIITATSNGITSIDQTFNGFGYIGSTVFALPGVKGLIPNYRNEDGSLKNEEFVVNNVLTKTFEGATREMGFWLRGNYISNIYINGLTYDAEKNIMVNSDGVRDRNMLAGTFTINRGVISNFNPKTPFQAVDRNDSSWLSGLGMPSNMYIDLTLGASGTTYTAPANGYFFLAKKATAQGQYIDMIHRNSSKKMTYVDSGNATGNNTTVRVKTEAKKGEVVQVDHTTAGVTDFFRFIYAEGETE